MSVRKTVTIRCAWRDIPQEYRNDEDSIPYIMKNCDVAGTVEWEEYAYFDNDHWCLDGVITNEPTYVR